MKSKRDLGLRHLGLVGIVSLPLIFGGCAPEMENLKDSDIISTGIAAYLGLKGETLTPEQRAALIAGAQLTAEAGRREHELEKARVGKPELNVNVNTNTQKNSQQNSARTQDYFFVCSSWEDVNKDGALAFNEFKGVRRIFTTNENFYLLATVYNKNNLPLTLKIIGPTGESFTYSRNINYENCNMPFGQFQGSRFKKGSHKAMWHAGNEFIGENDFEVVYEQNPNMSLEERFDARNEDVAFACQKRIASGVNFSDFEGIKTRFLERELITFVSKMVDRKGSIFDFKLINPRGNFVGYTDSTGVFRVSEYKDIISSNDSVIFRPMNVAFGERDQPGTYTGVWSVDGKPYLTNRVEIVRP